MPKYSGEFQQYLRQTADPDAGAEESGGGRVDHSTFGARYVFEAVGGHRGQLLAHCVAGHHSGLPDAVAEEALGERSTLMWRLKHKPISAALVPTIHIDKGKLHVPVMLDRKPAFQAAFFTRMLFSCLVDADRTATEEFCQPDAARLRAERRPALDELRSALESFLDAKETGAERTAVNKVRSSVLQHCRAAVPLKPGFFALNVPTGGGKTYSSLAFALGHAVKHRLRRVLAAIPFTSIIEQTADAYREAMKRLADDGLIEHHTNIEPKKDTRRNQLGAENWDAPLVVTTNVQLFETLFAAGTTPCRKLHRLARSVIILDEAQTIPVELLQPALATLDELVCNYGCSVVLCTATLPAFEQRDEFPIGLQGVRQIIPEPAVHFDSLKRVEIRSLGVVSDEDLVGRVFDEPSVLCIVNTRSRAARLYEGLARRGDRDACFHLSTWMCGQHRRDVLAVIRHRLRQQLPCRVVSTQLVEAGVDVDFPVVYRAIAGFDSIAQAAGRCNREGKLEQGLVYLFESEELPPPGFLRDSALKAQELMGTYPDPIAPHSILAYFRLFYWSQQHKWDHNRVLQAFQSDLREDFLPLQFRQAAARFRMIQDRQHPVLVPYDGRASAMLRMLLQDSHAGVPHRKLQPYLVSIEPHRLEELEEKGLLMEHEAGVWLLLDPSAYSDKRGLITDAAGLNPAYCVV